MIKITRLRLFRFKHQISLSELHRHSGLSHQHMVSKHVCGYEQKLTRIYDYGYTYDKRGNLVKEEEICSPTTGPRNITMDLKKLQTTTLR